MHSNFIEHNCIRWMKNINERNRKPHISFVILYCPYCSDIHLPCILNDSFISIFWTFWQITLPSSRSSYLIGWNDSGMDQSIKLRHTLASKFQRQIESQHEDINAKTVIYQSKRKIRYLYGMFQIAKNDHCKYPIECDF